MTKDQIAAAIERVIDEPPTPEDVDQVAGRLAAVGWPLVSSRS